ncbi:origin recognition complex subunit 4, variant 3 [Dionaea muscipula]
MVGGIGIPGEETLALLRSRLCDPFFIFSHLSLPLDSNYSKLKFMISGSVTEACNNSVLLLGPRGSGKSVVLELVIADLLTEYPDMISVIRLNGLMHTDDNCALKEIARQLCVEHKLLFSKMASFDDNTQFVITMLRECGLAHKTIIFVLDEFDLFAQGKQRLLYSLLDAMQSVTSQAAVIGISCRLDADQLLEKRVRSRFSHRKLLFPPPSKEDYQRLLEHIFSLPLDCTLPHDHATKFNSTLQKIMADDGFKDIIDTLLASDSTVHSLLRFLFSAVSSMDLESGLLTLENFKAAMSVERQPKFEYLKDCSYLELYILVCMKRLEAREKPTYNFNSVYEEYKAIRDRTLPHERSVCLQAFEHLVQCELISLVDSKGYNQSIEFRPVKLVISFHQLHQRLKLNDFSNSNLLKLFDQAGRKC